jgi:TetR/AcrR family transcriptional regulator, transcriptional repressor for nem operon
MPVSSSSSVQGRPREFEIDDAVESAMQVFWSRGYHGTSLVDLIDGTGLSRGSLYKAFGDKHGLFIAALQRYIAGASERLSETLRKSASAKMAIREMLTYFAGLSCAEEGQRGCLLLATATEMVPHDAEIAAYVESIYNHMRHEYAVAIKRGQSNGEISAALDAQATAGLIVCIANGMRVLGKTGVTKREINAVVDTAMTLLD